MSGRAWKQARRYAREQSAFLNHLRRSTPWWRRVLGVVFPGQLRRWTEREHDRHTEAIEHARKTGARIAIKARQCGYSRTQAMQMRRLAEEAKSEGARGG